MTAELAPVDAMRGCGVRLVRLLLLCGLVLPFPPARADVALAPLFRDGAVLQRAQPLPVWGYAKPGERITVRFRTTTVETTATSDGHWRLILPAQAPSTQPAEMIVKGNNTLHVRDVLVGDVWLCAGQSNMEWIVGDSANAAEEIAAANFPLIRHFKIPHLVAARPQADLPGEWVACNPSTVAAFSAVAYFFARELQRKTGIPIGLVNSSWGGTQVESWMSPAAVRASPYDAALQSRWQKRLTDYPANRTKYESDLAKWQMTQAASPATGQALLTPAPREPEGPDSRWMPGGLYNAMIAPLVPAALRGVIWYQGEANAPRHSEYAVLFTSMIQQWREAFGRELPFYFVQLANHNREFDKTRQTWAYLREAQASALALPATGMAVTIDIGDVTNVHPKNKQEVGRRLALIARAQLEHEAIEYSGPQLAGATPEGRAIRVRFRHAAGLQAGGHPLAAFEIAGADHRYLPAEATIEGETVVVMAPTVTAPVAVRYAWHNFPDAGLFNGAGLPAAPFRTDRW